MRWLLLLVVSASACRSIAVDVAKCERGEIPTVLSGFVPVVTHVLLDGAQNWSKQLDTLGGDEGITLAPVTRNCLVADATAALIESHVMTVIAQRQRPRRLDFAVDPRLVPPAIERGRMYLRTHKP